MNWLYIIRPDWFDMNYEILPQVQTYLMMKNILETRNDNFPIEKLTKLILENSEFDSYRSKLIHLIMQYERWDLIYLVVKYEHDWTFLNNQSTKVIKNKNILFKNKSICLF